MFSIERKATMTGHNGAVFGLDWGQSANVLYSAGGDGWIVEWDIENPEMGRLIAKAETSAFALKYLPETNALVAGNMHGGVHWIYPDNPEKNTNFLHHGKGVYAFASSDGYLFSAGGKGKLTKWDIQTGKPVESIQLSKKSLRSLSILGDRTTLVVGSSDSNIYLVDADRMMLKGSVTNAHKQSVFCAVPFNDDTLISGGRDAQMKTWNLDDLAAPKKEIAAHMYSIYSIALHPSKTIFATSSRDKTIKLWSAEDFKLLKVLEGIRDNGHFNSVNKLLWSDHNNYLISAGDDRNIILWKVDLKKTI